MKLVNNINYADGKLWRGRPNYPCHDIKYNIRKNSIFEKINISLQVLYFFNFF